MTIWVGTANPHSHWFRVMLGTRLRIPLRGLLGFWVTPVYLVPAPFHGSSIRRVLFLIRFLIFQVAFSQDFLVSAGNLETFVKFLCFGMKWDTYETDYPNTGNELFNYFTNTLKILCKNLPILFAKSSTPFFSLCAFLIRSQLFNLKSLALIFGCT